MTPLPILWAASFLLVAGGIAKVRHPAATIPALRAVGIDAHRNAVVFLGFIEVAVGVGALSGVSNGFDGMVAVLYAAFAAFSARLVAIGAPGVSCGCAGERSMPPSLLHTILNVVAAAGAVAAALGTAAPHSGLQFAALAGGSLVIAWAAYLCVAYVPTLFSSYGGAR
ncbi:MAG: MauE/DoxX family redox-associated membrane protein [Actinomycetota bacterium]